MTRSRALPLGIDVGRARVRVALTERDDAGVPALVAVAARDRSTDVAADIVEAVRELGCAERRCVMAVGAPVADIRRLAFPRMTNRERLRAARFEIARFIGFDVRHAVVRVGLPDERGIRIVGAVRTDALAELTDAARRARLRLLAVDHAGLALQRALPESPVVVDIGAGGTVVHVRGAAPSMTFSRIGGRTFTDAVAASLDMDTETAERRKCSVGLGGCARDVRDELVDFVAVTVAGARARAGAGADVDAIALVGNGARLADLAVQIERATAVPTVLASLRPETSQHLPPDVLRAAAPDWALAYGLSLWEHAA